jgi:hypothetical protein
MAGIIGVIALLTVLGLSLIITRVATIALTMTGLSQEAAHFQARSAFTGTGFTTSEAESVVNHPVRRRIIMLLMILRSAGLVTIVFSLILSFLGSGGDIAKLTRLSWLAAGVAGLWLLSGSKVFDRYLGQLINWALRRWTSLDVRDYASLLRLSGEYRVIEVQVRQGDWVAGKNLQCCYLPEEGITVLGISRANGSYVGGPKGETEIFPGDTLILYGRAQKLQELDERRADVTGDEAHARAVREQKQRMEEQERREREYKARREAEMKQQAS